MKKLIIALAAVFAFFSTTGCTADLEDLMGTVWEASSGSQTVTLDFSGNTCMMTTSDGANEVVEYYAYTYSFAAVVIYKPDKDGNPVPYLHGSVSPTSMTLVEYETQSVFASFVRK